MDGDEILVWSDCDWPSNRKERIRVGERRTKTERRRTRGS